MLTESAPLANHWKHNLCREDERDGRSRQAAGGGRLWFWVVMADRVLKHLWTAVVIAENCLSVDTPFVCFSRSETTSLPVIKKESIVATIFT